MVERLGDAPIGTGLPRYDERRGEALDKTFNSDAEGADKAVGFVLLVFEYGEKRGRCNFISSGADRKDIVTLFKENDNAV